MFSLQRQVLVDECPNCGGFWLDAGELADIREETQAAKEHRKAKHARLNQVALEALTQGLSACQAAAPANSRVARRLQFINSTVRYLSSGTRAR